MFDELEAVINAEKKRIEQQRLWITNFRRMMDSLPDLGEPWFEKRLSIEIIPRISDVTKIAAIDGGLISEAMSGFDLILYRAVGVVFQGVGSKVNASYVPSIDPVPEVFFHPSLSSRHEFSRLSTLKRLYIEYKTVIDTINNYNPTIVFIDGKLSPLNQDFIEYSNSVIKQAELDVKEIYRELIDVAHKKGTILCGIVKDSRSSEFCNQLIRNLHIWINDQSIGLGTLSGWRKNLENISDEFMLSHFLSDKARTAWLKSSLPKWVSGGDKFILASYVKAAHFDFPIRFEVLSDGTMVPEKLQLAISALLVLTNHGLPSAIPTIIIEADDRAKLTQHHLEMVLDQISIQLDIPLEILRKRRHFYSQLS
ncbi:MAG: DNA double-strand break repair nuclease NurA [Candidatus Heimdallarchaeota archaeon]|nr:DNA double-strand break repair nuclease NurA [Candidatus Heimdallarchaeota archaeon]MDH5644611.1 DNA double-strand break repair nuclease NurA [Candidatus Heimdallarchaeota archaeon]